MTTLEPSHILMLPQSFEDASARAVQLNEEWMQYWRQRNQATGIDGRLKQLKVDWGDTIHGTSEWMELKERVERLESWRDEIQRNASLERLHAEEPVLRGWVKVVHRKERQDTETRGMNRSMEMERKEGWGA